MGQALIREKFSTEKFTFWGCALDNDCETLNKYLAFGHKCQCRIARKGRDMDNVDLLNPSFMPLSKMSHIDIVISELPIPTGFGTRANANIFNACATVVFGIHCKVGIYETSGYAAIVASECAADQQFCSATGCALGTEHIIMLWACEQQNDTQVIVNKLSFGTYNHTCLAQIGQKGANMSNEAFAFPELNDFLK
ncbi:hypothetical protein niasHT_012294 [Heterodera trifolii]|uniref:Uncharacterized protein n=1 Tax=Heterodera trifolii TaxID=157864 RepID=A0ABD2LFC2_9BILA